MRIIMKIQINSRVSESEEDEESLEDSNSESATSLIEHLNNELINLEPIFSKVEDHLSAVEKRVNQVSINSFYPLTDPVKTWCYKKGLSEPFTLEEWFQAVLTDVESSDLESRMLKFGEKNILWGKSEMSVFEILHSVPKYLACSYS
jgi:hypothetical protein